MRGFWIGLLGLESVFPEGIRWDRLKLGPATIKRYRVSIGALAGVQIGGEFLGQGLSG